LNSRVLLIRNREKIYAASRFNFLSLSFHTAWVLLSRSLVLGVYDTPGSPSWSKLFVTSDKSCRSKANEALVRPSEWLSSEQAKRVFPNAKLQYLQPCRVEFSFLINVKSALDQACKSTLKKLKYCTGKQMLTVNTEPNFASITILGTKPKYSDGMLLGPGQYTLVVKKSGYKTKRVPLTIPPIIGQLKPTHKTVNVTLEKKEKKKPKAPCSGDDIFADCDNGDSNNDLLSDAAESNGDDIFADGDGESFNFDDDIANYIGSRAITITSPRNGITTQKRVITLTGRISRQEGDNARLFLSAMGVKQEIAVRSDGSFSNPVVLSHGQNTIELKLGASESVFAVAREEGVTQRLTVNKTGERSDFRATLVWNTNGSDLDLHVIDPSGRDTYYSNKRNGTTQLDVDDTNGFGPENITNNNANSGVYHIQVINYSGGRGATARLYRFIDENLESVETHTFRSSKETWNVGTFDMRR
jgi:uncharacterized protein YfaP (DUF2135 family)